MVNRPGVPVSSTVGFNADNFGDNTVVPTKYFISADIGAQMYQDPPLTVGVNNPNGLWKPENPLSAFVGQDSAGTWRLDVQDCAGGDTGTIQKFILLLGKPAANPVVCYPNCDQSTSCPVVNTGDFTCFLQQYAAAQPLPSAQQQTHYANCDGSTTFPQVNTGDFTCFLQKYADRCSGC